jgi:hypothetical protein
VKRLSASGGPVRLRRACPPQAGSYSEALLYSHRRLPVFDRLCEEDRRGRRSNLHSPASWILFTRYPVSIFSPLCPAPCAVSLSLLPIAHCLAFISACPPHYRFPRYPIPSTLFFSPCLSPIAHCLLPGLYCPLPALHNFLSKM